MSLILAHSAEELIHPGFVLTGSDGVAGDPYSDADFIPDLRARNEDSKYCLKNCAVINAATCDRGSAT